MAHREGAEAGLQTTIDRRTLLRLLGAGGAAIAAGGAGLWLRDRAMRSAVEPDHGTLPPSAAGSNRPPDVEIALKASPATVSLLPGAPTRVWKYTGEVLRGDPGCLQATPGSYLGPTLHLRKGQRVRIHFTNDLLEDSIIHWHGLYVPAAMDGHPRSVIAPGEIFVYEFDVTNRAGTYWYHPHPHERTGPQVYYGLAGLLLIGDEEEQRLPSGPYDLPLILQDRLVDEENQFVYLVNPMMGGMNGFLGDRILVNGRADFTLSVATRAYRLRLLNGSNSRIYKLAWSDGTAMTVIGTDGGLLETPVQRPFVMLAPAERIELLVDFSKYPLGTELELRSLEFSGAQGGMMGGMGMMGSNASLPNGAPFSVLKVKVARRERAPFVLPTRLTSIPRYRASDAINVTAPRRITLSMGHMTWLMNGRSFQMDEVADDETVRLNTLEVWEIVSEAGRMGGMGLMGGMAMPHPFHIHGVQFQVIERHIAPEYAAAWESVRGGFVGEGWKDTVLVMPGETVKLLLRFEKYPGLFMYHCHNLEHEDRGMMRNYQIRA
jgi:FtsP/CotA-like multicopper oxidase with cupredoxin domain